MAREIDALRHRLAGGPPTLPEHDELRAVALRAGGADVVDHVQALLPEALPARRAAVDLPALGLLPADPSALARAMDDAIGRGPHDAQLALAVSTFAPVTVRALQAVARPGTDPAVAAPVVLRYAAQIGRLEPAANDVAGGLDLDRDLGVVLQMLGVPHFVLRDGRPTPAQAAAHGAAAAGAPPPTLAVVAQGAQRHQVAAWIRVLLADIPGPASALLRAASARGIGVGFVASAAWLSAWRPTADPVHDVVFCNASLDRARFSAARRAIGSDDLLGLRPRIGKDEDLTVLAVALRGDPVAVAALVDAALGEGDEATARAAAVVAQQARDRIVAALTSPRERPWALYLAAFLDEPPPGLAELEVPATDRGRLAWALAAHDPQHPRLDRLGPLSAATSGLR